jgi:hypothetical protein
MVSRERTRPPKSSKGKAKQKAFSVVDPVTGTVVKSDVVYGPDSALSQNFIGQGGTSLEFEFSTDKIILNQVDIFTRDTPFSTSGSPTTTFTRTYRWVLEGSFSSTKNGKLVGTIGSITRGTFLPESYPGGFYETIQKSIENTTIQATQQRLDTLFFQGPSSSFVYKYANQENPYETSINSNLIG